MSATAQETVVAAEQSVLGALMLHAHALADVGDLRPDDFYVPRHQIIYAAIVAAHAENGITDPIAVEAELIRRGRLADAGGREQLLDLLESVVSAAAVAYHAAIVQQYAHRRALLEELRVATLRLHEGIDVAEVLADVRPRLDAIEKALPAATMRREPRAADVFEQSFHELDVAEMLATPPQQQRLLFRHPTRDGKQCPIGEGDPMMEQGITALLTGAGGYGKSLLALQACIAKAIGRPLLHFYTVGGPAKVVFITTEDRVASLHRRLHRVVAGLALDAEERGLLSPNLRIVPLAGKGALRLFKVVDGVLVVTDVYRRLRQLLELHAGEGIALVVLDPTSRLCGSAIELDNDLATAAVEYLDQLTDVPGNPTILLLAHVSKASQLTGRSEARGVTDLGNAVRWHVGLVKDKLEWHKSNECPPWTAPVFLGRHGGVFYAKVRTATDAARAAADDDVQAENAVLEAIESFQDGAPTKAAIYHQAGIREGVAKRALELLQDAGQVSKTRPYRRLYVTRPSSRPEDAKSPAGGHGGPQAAKADDFDPTANPPDPPAHKGGSGGRTDWAGSTHGCNGTHYQDPSDIAEDLFERTFGGQP